MSQLTLFRSNQTTAATQHNTRRRSDTRSPSPLLRNPHLTVSSRHPDNALRLGFRYHTATLASFQMTL